MIASFKCRAMRSSSSWFASAALFANGTSRPDLQGLGAEFAVGYSGANFHFSPDSCVSANDLAYPKKQAKVRPSSSAIDPLFGCTEVRGKLFV